MRGDHQLHIREIHVHSLSHQEAPAQHHIREIHARRLRRLAGLVLQGRLRGEIVPRRTIALQVLRQHQRGQRKRLIPSDQELREGGRVVQLLHRAPMGVVARRQVGVLLVERVQQGRHLMVGSVVLALQLLALRSGVQHLSKKKLLAPSLFHLRSW
jgi:hypothetical protein